MNLGDEFLHFVVFLHQFESVLGFEMLDLYQIIVAVFVFGTVALMRANSSIEVTFEVGREELMWMEARRI